MKIKDFLLKYPQVVLVLLAWAGVLIFSLIKLYVINETQIKEIEMVNMKLNQVDNKVDIVREEQLNLVGRLDELSRYVHTK